MEPRDPLSALERLRRQVVEDSLELARRRRQLENLRRDLAEIGVAIDGDLRPAVGRPASA